MKWQQKISRERLTNLSAAQDDRNTFFIAAVAWWDILSVLCTACTCRRSADKHILSVYSVNLISHVDFDIPDLSWHKTEKFNNNGEAALAPVAAITPWKTRHCFLLPQQPLKDCNRNLSSSKHLKILWCNCSVEVLMPLWLWTHILLVWWVWWQLNFFSIYENKIGFLETFAM